VAYGAKVTVLPVTH